MLDNCEHLLGPVVELVRALEEPCPKLVVLATSREGLGIAGERIVAVASLELPRSGDRDAVLRSDAARLFVERAVAVKSDFAVTDANAAAVAEVVRRLDGIPLALELAAARVPVLSPAQLAQRLDQRFRVLAGGERGAIERHATLRAAIDWSYDLLDDRPATAAGPPVGVRRGLQSRSGRSGVFRRRDRRGRRARSALRAGRPFAGRCR